MQQIDSKSIANSSQLVFPSPQIQYSVGGKKINIKITQNVVQALALRLTPYLTFVRQNFLDYSNTLSWDCCVLRCMRHSVQNLKHAKHSIVAAVIYDSRFHISVHIKEESIKSLLCALSELLKRQTDHVTWPSQLKQSRTEI